MSLFTPPKATIRPLSFGIERHIIESLSELQEVSDRALLQTVHDAFCLVYHHQDIEKELPALVEAVIRRMESIKDKSTDAPKTTTTPSGKTLGSRYGEWLAGLNSEQICLYLADYDLTKASSFYWRHSIEQVQEAVRIKSEQDSHRLLSQFEAVMYGMGGKYSDDDGGGHEKAHYHDLNSEEGLAALKSFGF